MAKRRRHSSFSEEEEEEAKMPRRVRRAVKYEESDESEAEEDLSDAKLEDGAKSYNHKRRRSGKRMPVAEESYPPPSLLVKLSIGQERARELGASLTNEFAKEESGSEYNGPSDEDNHDLIPRSRISRKSIVQDAQDSEEDEYIEEETEDPSEESDSAQLSSPSDASFVVDSDENEGRVRTRRSRRRRRAPASSTSRKRGRPRKIASESDYSRASSGAEDEEDAEKLSLQQELEELKNSESPPPRRKHLRARKEVNYQILPAPVNDEPVETAAVTPANRRGGGGRGIRRLFPTTGPFGGNDVVSIFGTPAGQGVGSGPLEPFANVDSNSSDDDASAAAKFKSGTVGLRTKSGLADTDPLGIDTDIDFSAVGGLDNYINQLKEMVTLPLRYPEVYQRFGVTPPRGVLFHGPPGTGKTLMARALASSASTEGKKITFFMRKGADCLSKWVGEAERQLRILFEEAKNQQPSIIFFDEIDGLAPVRSSKQEQIHASIVSTLLALMDGMDNRGQVIVIGATNRPDSVDPALRRPGRFDREFYFPLPDFEARKKIISIHTRKWNPPVEPEFISHIAQLTKGYGGADLRALCTEAALNAIQRRYPQIYTSDKKLRIDPSSINVAPIDFLKSYEKIIPSSARSTSSGALPLPSKVQPLLNETFDKISKKLDHILPRQKKLTALEEAMLEEGDLSFAHQERMRTRVYRPRLLIYGPPGMGQQYIGAAILHHLEGFHIQSLDLGTLLSDSTRTPEAMLIQLMVEVKRHIPSVVFIPNLDTWYATITETVRNTFFSILRSLNPNDAILVLGIVESDFYDLDPGLKALFGFSSENRHAIAIEGGRTSLEKFFATAFEYIRSKPTEFPDPESRKKRALEELPEAPAEPEKQLTKQEIKLQGKKDMQLKNLLKVKLSGLMDLFKNRYKRFRKPPIEDIYLVHLFEPPQPDMPSPAYTKSADDMILEVATGKKYYNIDLDIIEERLWNGFYSEPKQFLRDLEMMYIDATATGDRERTVKASEMFANAQVAIEDLATADPQFIQNCKDMHQREIARQKKILEEQEKEQREKKDDAGRDSPSVLRVGLVNGSIKPEENPGHPVNGSDDVPVVDRNSPEQIKHFNLSDHDIEMEDVSVKVNGSRNAGTEIAANSVGVDAAVPVEPTPVESFDVVAKNPQLEDATVSVPAPEPEPEPPLILDESKLKAFAEHLISSCQNFSVEQLEQVNSLITDQVWSLRHLWNRNEIIDKLYVSFDEARTVIQSVE